MQRSGAWIKGKGTGACVASTCLCMALAPGRKRHLAAAGLSALMALVALHAQTGQGSIAGTVKDKNSAVIQGAAVEVLSEATGARETTQTNSVGSYEVLSLNPGEYTVNVSKAGFAETSTKAVTVAGVGPTVVDVLLAVGGAEAVVTVSAETDLLSKSESDVTTTVDHNLVLSRTRFGR